MCTAFINEHGKRVLPALTEPSQGENTHFINATLSFLDFIVCRSRLLLVQDAS